MQIVYQLTFDSAYNIIKVGVRMKFEMSPDFKEFLGNLPKKDRLKLASTIFSIESKGIETAKKMKWIKKLEDNLFEIRSTLGSNTQRGIYFHIENDRYYLTHGFSKKTQKTPPKEIRKAKNIRYRYFLERGRK